MHFFFVFRLIFLKFDVRTFWISWKMYKKLKTVDFFNMQLFIFEIESFNFCICQKTTFAWSDLEQASSWWINSKFCVYKVSIWRCQLILTFSGLHFLFYMTPLNFQQGLIQPLASGLEIGKTHHCAVWRDCSSPIFLRCKLNKRNYYKCSN